MRTPFYRREEVEALAIRLHRQLAVLLGEPPELPIDVDLIGEQLLGLSWLYEPIPEPRGTTILAALHPEQRLIVLNERHVETFGRNEGLERFTKAHELGHWVLHVGEARGQGLGESSRRVLAASADSAASGETSGQEGAGGASDENVVGLGPPTERRWQEIQANWFAAALLMPPLPLKRAAATLDLTGWRGRYELCNWCGVSISALNSRLRQLGYPSVSE